ncbi:MAG: TetR family transcriptional regulator [Microbacteriaceae bacterium]|nr:TetR family transcriptional regulator [Microbacteriaceae bacterium]
MPSYGATVGFVVDYPPADGSRLVQDMSAIAPSTRATAFSETRDRIVRASYALFSRRSTRDVAMDEVVAASGVAKATLYRHFPTKDALVLAFLERREEVWTLGIVEAGARARSEEPEGRLLAIFDVFEEWFQRDDYEACSFVNVLLEMGMDHPLGRASSVRLANIRGMVSRFAREAGLRDPDDFALSWHILMKGAIVQAAEGDRNAAARAKLMAAPLIERYRA